MRLKVFINFFFKLVCYRSINIFLNIINWLTSFVPPHKQVFGEIYTKKENKVIVRGRLVRFGETE